MLAYRKEIDGLRALAVLPVIFFHAGFEAFSGGFVGVDVFFVISGYLITSIIWAEKQAGTFTLTRFYERRARRILPALFFVIVCCLPFAWLWMLPFQLEEFAHSVVAVTVFVSNFLFWQETGYFAQAAELKPLIHTWSLAVEEQFYVFFPLFLLLFWRSGRRWITSLVVVGFVLSLALAQLGGNFHVSAPYIDDEWRWSAIDAWSFFLTPSRAWELLIGVLAALYLIGGRRTPGHAIAEIGSFAGLALIVLSVALFDSGTPFPGISGLLPTGGAVLVILFARSDTTIGRLLSLRPMVGIGLISYSLYLWHQPLFAFARLRHIGEPDPLLFLGLCLLALGLAVVSYRYVERPFRNRAVIPRPMIFSGALASSAVLMLCGGVLTLSGVNAGRFSATETAFLDPPRAAPDSCRWRSPFPAYPGISVCDIGATGRRPDFVLFGDSHANSIMVRLSERARDLQMAGLFIRNSYCQPIVGLYNATDAGPSVVERCRRHHDFLLDYLAEAGIRTVILANRWSMRLFPVAGEIAEPWFDNGEGGVEGDVGYREYVVAQPDGTTDASGAAKISELERFVGGFLADDRRVLLVYPIPEVGVDIKRVNLVRKLNGEGIARDFTTSRRAFEARNRFIIDAFDGLGARRNLVRIRPSDVLCDSARSGRCFVQKDGVPLYYDDDHVSDAGAGLIVDLLEKQLRPTPSQRLTAN